MELHLNGVQKASSLGGTLETHIESCKILQG